MFTKLVFLGVLFLAAAAANSVPKPCCMPEEWSSNITDLVPMARGSLVFNTSSYSFKLKKVAVRSFQFAPNGGPIKLLLRSVYDYNVKKVFFITPDGTCISAPNTVKMTSPCIPDYADYLGSSYFGFIPENLPCHIWRFKDTHTGRANITIAFTQTTCVPIIQGMTGELNGVNIAWTSLYTGYQPEVKDKSVYDVPDGCVMHTSQANTIHFTKYLILLLTIVLLTR